MVFPERFRSVLESFVEDLKVREIVSGIGLFGSWSRGDAVPSSDVDFLIVEDRDFDYEYTERINLSGCFVDLNYVPRSWVAHRIPPEIDQKLYELRVIFDRDGSLTRAKDLMSKVFWRPERVEIRSEAYLVEADAHLSRARSAFNMDDFQSAKVNALRSFWVLMKILIEIGRRPVLNSRFVRSLDSSSRSLEMYNVYEKYVGLMGLDRLSKADVKSMLDLLSSVWGEAINFIAANPPPKTVHPRMIAKINYYGKKDFLNGLVARISALVDENALVESAHYMFHNLADMIENYAYLVSIVENIKFDYAAIFRCLKESKKSPAEIYQGVLKVLDVRDVASQEAERIIKETTNIAMNIRQRRKDLIARLIS
ncbi:nucleotidyltransferase domain-containing protein [Candidatus Bathyarchaeota archaeon]|nr:nucleotidyltransferase domain-containing protein [Candidatus Bathyarchaeota archaeon]